MAEGEIASITAVDAAIAGEAQPDYIVMLRALKSAKQANAEQLTTLIRMAARVPPESGGLRAHALKAKAVVGAWFGTTAALRSIRATEIELLKAYTDAVQASEGLARRALRKALGRSLVNCHLLTAHIAKQTGSAREAAYLPFPLQRYFAGERPKACMRCHLDRAGARPPLERGSPYTYVCGACHDEVRRDFPPDLAAQIDFWPERVQRARVVQRALGRASVLTAIQTVLHPLSGLPVELPVRAAARADVMPALEPAPAPRPDEVPTVLRVTAQSPEEEQYVAALFDYRSPRSYW